MGDVRCVREGHGIHLEHHIVLLQLLRELAARLTIFVDVCSSRRDRVRSLL